MREGDVELKGGFAGRRGRGQAGGDIEVHGLCDGVGGDFDAAARADFERGQGAAAVGRGHAGEAGPEFGRIFAEIAVGTEHELAGGGHPVFGKERHTVECGKIDARGEVELVGEEALVVADETEGAFEIDRAGAGHVERTFVRVEPAAVTELEGGLELVVEAEIDTGEKLAVRLLHAGQAVAGVTKIRDAHGLRGPQPEMLRLGEQEEPRGFEHAGERRVGREPRAQPDERDARRVDGEGSGGSDDEFAVGFGGEAKRLRRREGEQRSLGAGHLEAERVHLRNFFLEGVGLRAESRGERAEGVAAAGQRREIAVERERGGELLFAFAPRKCRLPADAVVRIVGEFEPVYADGAALLAEGELRRETRATAKECLAAGREAEVRPRPRRAGGEHKTAARLRAAQDGFAGRPRAGELAIREPARDPGEREIADVEFEEVEAALPREFVVGAEVDRLLQRERDRRLRDAGPARGEFERGDALALGRRGDVPAGAEGEGQGVLRAREQRGQLAREGAGETGFVGLDLVRGGDCQRHAVALRTRDGEIVAREREAGSGRGEARTELQRERRHSREERTGERHWAERRGARRVEAHGLVGIEGERPLAEEVARRNLRGGAEGGVGPGGGEIGERQARGRPRCRWKRHGSTERKRKREGRCLAAQREGRAIQRGASGTHGEGGVEFAGERIDGGELGAEVFEIACGQIAGERGVERVGFEIEAEREFAVERGAWRRVRPERGCHGGVDVEAQGGGERGASAVEIARKIESHTVAATQRGGIVFAGRGGREGEGERAGSECDGAIAREREVARELDPRDAVRIILRDPQGAAARDGVVGAGRKQDGGGGKFVGELAGFPCAQAAAAQAEAAHDDRAAAVVDDDFDVEAGRFHEPRERRAEQGEQTGKGLGRRRGRGGGSGGWKFFGGDFDVQARHVDLGHVHFAAEQARREQSDGNGRGGGGEARHREGEATGLEAADADADLFDLHPPVGLPGRYLPQQPRLHGGCEQSGDADQAAQRGAEAPAEPAAAAGRKRAGRGRGAHASTTIRLLHSSRSSGTSARVATRSRPALAPRSASVACPSAAPRTPNIASDNFAVFPW